MNGYIEVAYKDVWHVHVNVVLLFFRASLSSGATKKRKSHLETNRYCKDEVKRTIAGSDDGHSFFNL